MTLSKLSLDLASAAGRKPAAAYTPTFRFDLRAQDAPMATGNLFDVPEDRACNDCGRPLKDHDWQGGCPDACSHPSTQDQITLAGSVERICNACGQVQP